MPRSTIPGRLRVGASTVLAACALAAALASPAAASSGGTSSGCEAVGGPTTTETIAIPGVFHITVYTCAAAHSPTFAQCSSQTVEEPNLVHATVYYCIPPQALASYAAANSALN